MNCYWCGTEAVVQKMSELQREEARWNGVAEGLRGVHEDQHHVHNSDIEETDHGGMIAEDNHHDGVEVHRMGRLENVRGQKNEDHHVDELVRKEGMHCLGDCEQTSILEQMVDRKVIHENKARCN